MKNSALVLAILFFSAIGNAKDAKIRQILLQNKKVSLDQIGQTEIKVGVELIPIQEKNCILKVTSVDSKKILADANKCNDLDKLKKNDVFEVSDFVSTDEKPKVEEAKGEEAPVTPSPSITETSKTTGFQVLGGVAAGSAFAVDYTNGYNVRLNANPALQIGARYQYLKNRIGFNIGYLYESVRDADEVEVDDHPDSVFTETKYGKLGFSLVEANVLVNFGRFYGNLGLHKPIIYEDKDWGKVEAGTGIQVGLGTYFYERFFGEGQLRYTPFDWTPTAGTTYDMFLMSIDLRVGYTF